MPTNSQLDSVASCDVQDIGLSLKRSCVNFRWNTAVSGEASNHNTPVSQQYTVHRPVLTQKNKPSNITVSPKASQDISTVIVNVYIQRPSHTTHKTAKNAVIFHIHYKFFSQLQRIFSQCFF